MCLNQFMKPGILVANVNHECIANIKYLMALVAVVPILKSVKALGFWCTITLGLCMWFPRTLNQCTQYVHDLYGSDKIFNLDAFSCFIWFCDLSHEGIPLRFHLNVNDCVEHFRSVGVICFVFHILQLMWITFTQQNSCCNSKSTMKHMQNWIENWTSPYLVIIIRSASLLIS